MTEFVSSAKFKCVLIELHRNRDDRIFVVICRFVTIRSAKCKYPGIV